MLSLEGQEAGGGTPEGQLEHLEQLEQLLTVAAPGAGQPSILIFPCLQGHAYYSTCCYSSFFFLLPTWIFTKHVV